MDIEFIATMRTAILRKSSYVELLKTKNEMKPLKIYKIIVRSDKKKHHCRNGLHFSHRQKTGEIFIHPAEDNG